MCAKGLTVCSVHRSQIGLYPRSEKSDRKWNVWKKSLITKNKQKVQVRLEEKVKGNLLLWCDVVKKTAEVSLSK